MLLVPNIFLAMFQIPATSEVWIRVVGVLVFNIGIYYIYAAKCEARAFFQASIYTRIFVLLAFTAFAALGLASPRLILLSFTDVLGAIAILNDFTRLRRVKSSTRRSLHLANDSN